jgi:hypothetical protein
MEEDMFMVGEVRLSPPNLKFNDAAFQEGCP